jgi:hypothetical protein
MAGGLGGGPGGAGDEPHDFAGEASGGLDQTRVFRDAKTPAMPKLGMIIAITRPAAPGAQEGVSAVTARPNSTL